MLRSQCDSRMNMPHHTGFLYKQTATWQNFDGAIYWLCQNTLKKKTKTDSALFWALFKNWGRSLGFSGSGEISISMCEDHLNVWPSAPVLTKTFRVCSQRYCSNNIPHWLCTITAANRSWTWCELQLGRASNAQAACNNEWSLSSRHDKESFEWRTLVEQ